MEHLNKASSLKERQLDEKSKRIYDDQLSKAKIHEMRLKAQTEQKMAKTLAYLAKEIEQQKKLQEWQANRPTTTTNKTNEQKGANEQDEDDVQDLE